MDRIKRHMAVNMPVIRACYSQDITPQERHKHIQPMRMNRKSPHGWEVPGKEHPTIKRKVK
ncbi:MAG: hypothetical protein FVQ82_06785 [Planctomycetes bacterium]|nr:hypothetical protein [Planctomycetota bacterium]